MVRGPSTSLVGGGAVGGAARKGFGRLPPEAAREETAPQERRPSQGGDRARRDRSKVLSSPGTQTLHPRVRNSKNIQYLEI